MCKKLDNWFSIHDRGFHVKIAREFRCTSEQLSQWRHGVRPIPPARCWPLYELLKKYGCTLTVKDFRPDDWHLIWPHLAARAKRAGKI